MIERRASVRVQSIEGSLPPRVRVRPGREVEVLDASASGVLIESSHRWLPGARLELLVNDARGPRVVRGRVARCFVASIAGGIRYRAGVELEAAFDAETPAAVLASLGSPHDVALPA